MSGFLNAVSASFVLLLLMSVGYFMGHLGWMHAQEKKFLSSFLINIAVPCNCLVGILNNLERDSLAQAGTMLLSAYLGVTVNLLLGFALAVLLKMPRERWGVFVCMVGLSNTLFIGIPVCKQLFGDACMGYLMLYYLANTTYVQSVAILLVERSGTAGRSSISAAGLLRSVFTKPPILAVLFSVALLLLGLRPPEPVMSFASYISGCVSPLALLYCGFIIYELGLRNVRLMRGLPTMLVMRLGVAPVICWCFCRLFHVEGLAMNVFLVESALPVVSQVTVMAGAYGADEQYAATGATLSTLCSFFTIPILMLILG